MAETAGEIKRNRLARESVWGKSQLNRLEHVDKGIDARLAR